VETCELDDLKQVAGAPFRQTLVDRQDEGLGDRQGGALGEVPSAGQRRQKRARDVVGSVAHPAHVARWVPGLFVACRAPNAELATTIEATTG